MKTKRTTKAVTPAPKTLGELLDEAESHFNLRAQTGLSHTYEFALNRFPNSWEFRVVNSWNRWMSAGLKYDFQGETPHKAVQAFLDYVREKRIMVSGLQG